MTSKLIADAESDLKEVGHAIGGVFTSIEGELETFFEKGAAAIATTIKTQLPAATKADVEFVLQSAVAAVAIGEAAPGGGQAKMEAALASFVTALATKGIVLIETQMRALIENALTTYKALVAAAPTTGVSGA